MTTKAVCVVFALVLKSETEFTASISFVSPSTDETLSGSLDADLQFSETSIALELQVEAAVKAYLQSQGVVFGPLDRVRLIGGSG